MDEAIVVAGENRPHLIAMITIAAILTRLLLAFTLGKGSAFRQPLAIAIISGLIIQMPLVLVLLPALLKLFLKERTAF